MKKIFLSTIFVFCATALAFGQTATATYSVTFISNWSQATHPHSSGNLPANAHWSKLVGATHNDQIHFLEMGELATVGIEAVAESGNNAVFFSEVNSAIGSGMAYSLVDGPSLGTALGEISIPEITTTSDFPRLSLVTMIAPSPDWIAAIDSVELIDGNGDWIETINLSVFPYDAGTDNGIDYTSPNSDTVPKENISNAAGVMPFSSEPIGTFMITLESVVLGVNELERNIEIIVYPNPARDDVTISSSKEMASVSIFNTLGKLVFNELASGYEKQIDLSSLTSGIYLIQLLDSEGARTVQKLVKL